MANVYERERMDAAYLFDGVLTRRTMAFIIDYLIVLALMVPAFIVVFFIGVLTLGLGFFIYPVLFFIVAGLYFGLGLSSDGQATLGMRVMDLMMVTDDGRRIDFATAVAHVAIFWVLNSILTPFVLVVGLLTDRKRLLHDIALGTVQVRTSRWLARDWR
jgi:uncharacterized RDD family membrane protein YckC